MADDGGVSRIRLLDIAQEAGVSTTTVSLALRGHPRISEATRKRIVEVADRLGYRPDPVLQALARYRSQRVDADRGESIAFLVPSDDIENLEKKPNRLKACHGVRDRAHNLGYSLDIFGVGHSPKDWKRLQQVLTQRGVRGIILSPPPYQQTRGFVELDWSRFSTVTLVRNATGQSFSLVQPHFFLNGQILVKHLRSLGYTSAALYVGKKYTDWTEGAATTAVFAPEEMAQAEVADDGDRDHFLQWYEGRRPEMIITNLHEIPSWLGSVGVRVAEDVSLAFLDTRSRDALSGITVQASIMGKVAMDLLHAQLLSHEYGPPKVPLRVVVDGEYNTGTTVLA